MKYFLLALLLATPGNPRSREPQSPITNVTFVNQNGPCSDCANHADGHPRKWPAALEEPEWWLVILGFPTLIFLWIQALQTKRAAMATLQGTNALISKERARIKIGVNDTSVQIGQYSSATCWLENYGSTPAFINEFRARFVLASETNVMPDYAQCRVALYAESLQEKTKSTKSVLIPLEANDPMTPDTAMSIRNGKSFLHFYGFVTYRDVFDRNRRTNIHLLWTVRWGGIVEGQIMQWWEPVGLQEENSDA
ncbi:MAG TPA: hypothetical protein VGN39_03515 [Terriglobales bacterium]|nr:hypothetical protein [Terriglobales bacterium]